MNLSICMIIKNEAANLKELLPVLDSLNGELCIVDTGSTDESRELIQQYTGSCPHFEWCNDFSAARNYSLSLATKDTVLWLDADDRISSQAISTLQELCAKPVLTAFTCIIENPREGVAEVEKFRQLRIIPNNKNLVFKGAIHEELRSSCYEQSIAVDDCDIVIEHRGYFFLADRLDKTERNYQLLKNEYAQHPNDLYVVMEYGNSLYQKKMFSEAIEVYVAGFENSNASKESHAYLNLPLLIGNSYEAQGDSLKALEWFNTSIEVYPQGFTAHFKVARSLYAHGDVTSALSLFQEIVVALEKNMSVGIIAQSNEAILINSYSYCALIEAQNKNYTHAVSYFEKVLTQSNSAMTFDPWLYIESLVGAEMYEKAYTTVKNYNLSPTSVTQFHNYARILVGVGMFSDAVDVYRQLLIQNSESVSYISEYGICLFQLGKVRDAQQCFLVALEKKFSDDGCQNVLDTVKSLQNKQFIIERIAHMQFDEEEKQQLLKAVRDTYAER